MSGRNGRTRGDAGSALVTVLFISVGMLAIALVGAHMAMQGSMGSSVERKRGTAAAAAEAGLDATVSLLEAGAGNRCEVTGQLAGTEPVQTSYTVLVTYYDTSNQPVACDPATGPTAGAVGARARSKARPSAHRTAALP